MNEPTSIAVVPQLERRLEAAQRIATAAVHILRLAVASAMPGRVVALLDEIDDFFVLLDAVESSARMARACTVLADAEEHAEDAYHLAVAARRDARMRAERLRGDAVLPV